MTLTAWILILYLSGFHAGGPVSAVFQTEQACNEAGALVKQKMPGRYEGHVCVKDR